MKIIIAAVGRMKSGPELALCERYVTRIPWKIDIKEVEEKNISSDSARTKKEILKLQEVIPEDAYVVALDSRGKNLTSKDFASMMDKIQESHSLVAFVIGGAEGLSPELMKRAHRTLSFGANTWPHFMARVMLLEQIYRASSILANHPYHRE